MTVVCALAVAFAAAGAASAQIIPRIPPSAPPVSAPAIQASVLSAPATPDVPSPAQFDVRVLGVPGPGVIPAHIEAAKALAVKTGEVIVIHGSRQTGISHHTGKKYAQDTDLDLGLIGPPEKILSIERDMWDGRVPNAAHGPMMTVPNIEEAVGRGYLVVAPPLKLAPGALGSLQRKARPWRTAEQLAQLNTKPRKAGETFSFAVIGDAEPGRFWFSRTLFNEPGVFWRLLARANTSAPDFIFQLGDMVSRGLPSRFWSFIKGLYSAGLRSPYLTAIGNHDRYKPHGVTNDKAYRATFGNTNYLFDRGGWRFVVVDSSAGRITKEQLAWLSQSLDPKVPTVVFTHIPPAPLGEWTNWGALKGAGGFKEGAAEFMALMSRNKVSRVYMGHIHGLGMLERGDVKYVLTGGGGSPLYPGPVKRRLHHWMSVEAGPNGIVETVHPADGSSSPLR